MCWLRFGHLLVSIGLAFGLSEYSRAQEVSAFLDRAEIYQGETVLLTIEVAGQVVGDSPDVGQLTRDFLILDSQRNSQVEMIDDQPRSKDQWTFELEPKKSGELSIPAMAIGRRLRTQALSLTVLPLNDGSELQDESQDDDIFIEISAEPVNPYVQAQVRYSERLFYSVALREGSLSHVEPATDLSMERIGEEITYVAERDGVNYRVIERNYALFPQKSGEIAIPNVVFRGRVAQQSRTNSERDRFITRGRQVRIAAEKLVLNVRPRPLAYSAEHWLPSPELSVQETWSQQPPQFRVGEPITRTLILQARGLDATQLPEFVITPLSKANTYPDQALRETRHDDHWFVSRIEQRVAIVPNQIGNIELPEIRVAWWNTIDDREQVALIPAQTISVAAADINPEPAAIEKPSATPDNAGSLLTPLTETSGDDKNYWRWSSIILLILWLLTLLSWYRERSRREHFHNRNIDLERFSNAPSLKEIRRVLRQACRNNNPQIAAQALLDWAEIVWPQQPPTNLTSLAKLINNEPEPLLTLDRVLYAPTPIEWRGNKLWRAVKNGLDIKTTSVNPYPAHLSPLYPQRV